MNITARDLEQLHRDARLEREVLIEHRCRAGEDPHEFLPELPTIEELVVGELRTREIDERGLGAQFALARLAGRSSIDAALQHRTDADDLEREVLREIGLRVPSLVTTVWHMIGTVGER